MNETGYIPEDEEWRPPTPVEVHRFIRERLPSVLKGWLAPDRFQELLQDLEEIAAEEDNPMAERARLLHKELQASDTPYWENLALARFLFGVLVEAMINQADEEEGQAGA